MDTTPFQPTHHVTPPPHISNVIAHLSILLRETERGIIQEDCALIRAELERIKLYGSLVREKLGTYYDVEDQL
jgi:hypothetical protein